MKTIFIVGILLLQFGIVVSLQAKTNCKAATGVSISLSLIFPGSPLSIDQKTRQRRDPEGGVDANPNEPFAERSEGGEETPHGQKGLRYTHDVEVAKKIAQFLGVPFSGERKI